MIELGGYSPYLSYYYHDPKQKNVYLISIVLSNFTQQLRQYLDLKSQNITIRYTNHSKQKELRIIDTLEPLLNQHRLVISPQLIRQDFDTNDANYQLFHQITRITKDRGSLRNDDRIDVLSIACAYWLEQLAVDTDRQLQDHRNDKLDRELENFIENALGGNRGTKGNLWYKV